MSLFVGVAREIITPEVGGFLFGYNNHTRSHSVNDDLTVTALVIKSPDTSVMLISATVCLIHETLVNEICQKAGAAVGIPAAHVIVSATHTHSGPRTTSFEQFKSFGDADVEYCENIFVPKCVAAAKAAAADTKPVKVGIGTTQSHAGINRRQLHRDGTVVLGQNPWDTYDPTMTVISFNYRGKPLANIIHLGAHLTASGNNHEITRDWAGVMVDRLEAESDAITMFVNGAQGDIAPRMANGDSIGDLQHAMEVGSVAGIDAVRAYKTIRTFYDEVLQVVCGSLTLPFKAPIPAKEVQAILETYSKDSTPTFKSSALQSLAKMHSSGDLGPDEWKAKQVIVRIGPIVLVPFAFEVSSEIGLRLRAYSPFAHTLLLACTNGSNSYLPAQSQLCRGGYEVESFLWFRPRQLPDDSDTQLIEQNLCLIQQFGG